MITRLRVRLVTDFGLSCTSTVRMGQYSQTLKSVGSIVAKVLENLNHVSLAKSVVLSRNYVKYLASFRFLGNFATRWELVWASWLSMEKGNVD